MSWRDWMEHLGYSASLLLLGVALRFAVEGPTAYEPRDFIEHPAIGTALLGAAVAWISRPRTIEEAD